MKNFKKTLALSLAAVMAVSSVAVSAPSDVQAAKKAKKIKSVSVNGKTVKKGKTIKVTTKVKTLKVKIKGLTPAKASKAVKNFSFKTSKKKIAKINKKGKITVKKAGTAKITVTAKKNKKAKLNFKVKAIKSSKIKVNVTSAKTLNLKVGQTSAIKAATSPATTLNKGFAYASSKTTVAAVDAKGTITAKAAGSAVITVKSKDSNKTANVVVNVKANTPATVAVTGVSIKLDKTSIEEGQTAQATATVTPANASNKKVSFSTSDKAVATVDANGKVTGRKAGKAKITVTTDDGKKTASADIEVTAKAAPTPTEKVDVTGVTLDQKEIMLDLKKKTKEKLVATPTPDNATDKTITWTSADESIATVSAEGVVEAVKAGKTTVTAKTSNPEVSATCDVYVLQGEEVKVENGKVGVTKDAAAYQINGGVVLKGEDVQADNQTLKDMANKKWTIDTVYDLMKTSDVSTFKTFETMLDAKFGASSSKTEGKLDDVVCPGFWTAHSEGIKIEDGKTIVVNYKVTADADATDNWHGPLYVVYNGTEPKVNGEGYEEIGVVRGDNWAWTGAGNRDEGLGEGVTFTDVETPEDWEAYKSALKAGAEGTLTITRTGEKVTFAHSVAGAATELDLDSVAMDKDLYVSVFGEKATLTDIFYAEAGAQGFYKNIKLGADDYRAHVVKTDDKINVDVTGAKQFAIKDMTLAEETDTTDVHVLNFDIEKNGETFKYIMKIYRGKNKVELIDAEVPDKNVLLYEEKDTAYELVEDDELMTKLAMRIAGIKNPFEGLSITF